MAKNFLSLARGRLVQGNVYTSRSALSDINTRGTAERFISVKVETARILTGFKTTQLVSLFTKKFSRYICCLSREGKGFMQISLDLYHT